MKLRQVPIDLLLLVSVSVFCGDAASFMAPQKQSLIAKAQSLSHEDKEMPVTKHDKAAGGDYNKGSPLFAKQEARKAGGKTGKVENPPPRSSAITDGMTVQVTVPPQEAATNWKTWWALQGGWEGHIYKGLTHFLAYFIIVMFIAMVWVKCFDVKNGGRNRYGEGVGDRENSRDRRFAHGLFAMDHCCNHHASLLWCSFCCAPLRMADTYAKEPSPLVSTFWSALILITCLLGLSQLTVGFTHLIFLCMCIYFRQRMRKQYGLDSGGSTYAWDCLTWYFCTFCAIAQEARQVEFVRKGGDITGTQGLSSQGPGKS